MCVVSLNLRQFCPLERAPLTHKGDWVGLTRGVDNYGDEKIFLAWFQSRRDVRSCGILRNECVTTQKKEILRKYSYLCWWKKFHFWLPHILFHFFFNFVLSVFKPLIFFILPLLEEFIIKLSQHLLSFLQATFTEPRNYFTFNKKT